MSYGEAAPGVMGDVNKEVVQDISSTFFVLLAILFPTFTDIICGANLSGLSPNFTTHKNLLFKSSFIIKGI